MHVYQSARVKTHPRPRRMGRRRAVALALHCKGSVLGPCSLVSVVHDRGPVTHAFSEIAIALDPGSDFLSAQSFADSQSGTCAPGAILYRAPPCSGMARSAGWIFAAERSLS